MNLIILHADLFFPGELFSTGCRCGSESDSAWPRPKHEGEFGEESRVAGTSIR
jgi:hypothetical protein